MKLKSILLLLPLVIAAGMLNVESGAAQGGGRAPGGAYTFSTVPGDPTGARIYTLKNGLTVMISVNRNEPRIQTLITTRGGSKNDPSYKTGLAHYLEHMLFKGTDQFGTRDYAKEKVYLDEIEGLYEQYNHNTDRAQRAAIYHRIDSVSGVAAHYAIANEYDKLTGAIGAKGTNAFTSVEQTTYVNDIPQNQLEKWLVIEGERFRNPVFRLFHTELEAVYEEKNIGLDNDDRKANEALMAGLFQHHPYGTQTTIGTVEHLKNPSLKEIRKFYNTYYVPNNMAVILVGDLDPDNAVALVDKYMGALPSKPVPAFTFQPEAPHAKPTEINVYGPDAENVSIAYRFPGAGTRDAVLLELTDLLLAYKTAGLIDLNLKKKQVVLDAGSSPSIMHDYSFHRFSGVPKQGQTLEQVRDLLLQQIGKLKKGEFDEQSMAAVLKNLKVDQIRQYETNEGRAFALLDAFTLGQDWKTYSAKLDMMSHFTKKDIVEFANKYYGNDYVVVYKRIGEDKSVVKVEKPPITPVDVNRDDQSDFLKRVLAMKAPEIQPVFLDYSKDIARGTMKDGSQVYYLENKENGLFTLSYVFDMGKRNDKKLPFAIRYIQYLGTDKYSAEQLSKEFFKLGCEFNVASTDEQTTLTLSGLQESFVPAVELFDHLLTHVKPDQKALDGVIAQELKVRQDAKQDKRTILASALYSYAIYGKHNPFTDQLSEKELKGLKAEELVGYIKGLSGYKHRVLYYGPSSRNDVIATLDAKHYSPATQRDVPPPVQYQRNDMKESTVYFVNYDMVQTEVIWTSKSNPFDARVIPVASLFNEYYGGGMSSVIFQILRESKALAYSTFSSYEIPAKKTDPEYVFAYIGTQADKLGDAVPAMKDLLDNMPKTEQAFVTARDGLKNQLETERITKSAILFSCLAAEKRGLTYDVRKDVYNSLDKLTLADLQKFHDDRYKGRLYSLCVIGSKDKLDQKVLGQYGRVVNLSLNDIFGY
ncbi:MAG TPA: insulinase family protein [Candidatus Kapabacteria bacterium]|nr:insulinase family protein [Candidatus Kapabacteria bacterium]